MAENAKKVESVVSDSVVVQKKKTVSKESFIVEDAKNVGSYILTDVLLPAAKKAIRDIVTDGIEMLLYGSTRSRNDSGRRGAAYVSYDRFSQDRPNDYSYRSSPKVYTYNNLSFASRVDAEAVLESMREQLRRYGMCSVADMCGLANVDCEWTDNKFGWTSLKTAEIIRDRYGDGWIIKLPKAMPLD